MSAEDNLATLRRLFEEAWNKGNVNVLDEVLAPNYVEHDPATPGGIANRDQSKQSISMYRAAFPDLHFTLNELYAAGDNRVIARFTATGTNTGPLMGMPATGKQSTVTGMVLAQYENGKGISAYVNWDTLGMMQQLGLIPTAPQAAIPADVRPQQAH